MINAHLSKRGKGLHFWVFFFIQKRVRQSDCPCWGHKRLSCSGGCFMALASARFPPTQFNICHLPFFFAKITFYVKRSEKCKQTADHMAHLWPWGRGYPFLIQVTSSTGHPTIVHLKRAWRLRSTTWLTGSTLAPRGLWTVKLTSTLSDPKVLFTMQT